MVENLGGETEHKEGRVEPLTVRGKPLSDSYDLVLPHEHFLIHIRCYFEPGGPLADVIVSPETAPDVLAGTMACRDEPDPG